MKREVILIVLLIASSLAAQIDSKPPVLTAQSSVRIVGRDHRYVPHTESVHYSTSGDGPWNIYEEHFVTEETDGNCCFTRMTVIAYDVNLKGEKKRLWSISEHGDTGTLKHQFYEVFLGGCCGSSDTYTYFDPNTGKPAYQSAHPLLRVNVHYVDGWDRYVAVLDDRSPGHQLDLDSALLNYGSLTAIKQRLLFRFPNHPLRAVRLIGPHESGEEIRLNYDHRPGSPALLSGYSIEVTFYDAIKDEGIRVVPPVADDVVQVEGLTLPDGLTIENVALAAADREHRMATRRNSETDAAAVEKKIVAPVKH